VERRRCRCYARMQPALCCCVRSARCCRPAKGAQKQLGPRERASAGWLQRWPLCRSEFRPDGLSSSGDKAAWSPLAMPKPSRPENPASWGVAVAPRRRHRVTAVRVAVPLNAQWCSPRCSGAPGVAATPARVRSAEKSLWAAARRRGGAPTPTWLGGAQLALCGGSGGLARGGRARRRRRRRAAAARAAPPRAPRAALLGPHTVTRSGGDRLALRHIMK
jgi:hypothetical protein